MPKEMKFHGILAVGRTKADAVNNYRLLALNKGATVQVDSGRSLAFVVQASQADEMFNPMSGNMDLETDDDFVKQLEFASNSSANVEVNHLVCKSGCGAHVVFDSESLVKFCPHCTSSLSSEEESEDEGEEESDEDLDADESGDEESEEDGDDSDLEDESEEDAGEEESEDAGDESEESGDEESEEGGEPAEDESDTPDLADLTEDDGDISISEDGNGKGLTVAASSLEEAKLLFVEHMDKTSVSSDQTKLDAHYMVCSSDECGAHVVSTEEIPECPACDAPVKDPVEVASAPESVSGEDDLSEEESDEEEVADEEVDDENTLGLSDDEGNILEEAEVDSMGEVPEEGEESDSKDLDVSYSSSVAGKPLWTAFYKGNPIAIVSKSAAGKNEDIFDTPSFGHAVLATAKATTIRKALSELGFTPIKHKVSISKTVNRMVDEKVSESRESIAKEQSEYRERLQAALATAAIGLNRGFFADKKNPVKAALWNAMSSAGIRSPEMLIDTVFKSHSDAYHKTLFELASDLVSKSTDVQESLSKAIHGMSYQEASTSSDSSLEGRLETMGTSVSSEQSVDKNSQPVAVARQQISQAVKSLGRRGR